MTGIVLAGGRSSRLGRDKLAVELGGRTLLQRAVEAVFPLVSEVLVVTASGCHPTLANNAPKVRWVEDARPERGSLVGIYSGLRAAREFHSLVVAGDMPFLHQGLLRYVMGLAPGFDAVIPTMGTYFEPLHAVYSKDCLPHMEKLLADGELKILDVLPKVKVRYVEQSEIDKFDSRHLCFFNVNTEADLVRARELDAEVRV